MADFAVKSAAFTTSGASVVVPLSRLSPSNNIVTAPDGSGGYFDLVRSVVSHFPVFEAETEAIPSMLALIGANGQCLLPAGALRTMAVHWERKTDCVSGAAGATSHPRILIDAGLVSPLSITASTGTNARLSFRCDPIKDGVNDPFVLSTTALPTGEVLDQYTLGAVRIGNVVLQDTQEATIDFGLETEKTPALGSVHPETISVRKARPRATITGRDMSKIDAAAIPILGKSGTHANTEFWFRKRLAGGTFVDTATTEHFKITIAGFLYPESPGEGSGDANAQTRYVVEGVYDGTNAPLIITTGIAFTPGF